MSKKACLIYVKATEVNVESTKALLEAEGFEVCIESADPQEVEHLKEDDVNLPENLQKCIEDADVCVILYPEDAELDEGLAGVAGACSDSSSRVVGVGCGARKAAPVELDDFGDSYVHSDSLKLPDAINGEDCWENPDGSPAPKRKPKHLRCQ